MADTLAATLNFNTTAYNTAAWYALRPELFFDDLADVRTTPATHRGATVQFDILTDIAAQTTALTDGTDVTPVALADSTLNVALLEQGATILPTNKLRITAYRELNPSFANLIGFNAGLSMNRIARNVITAGTNVIYGGAATSRTTIAASSNITSAKVRLAWARLQGGNVQKMNGLYRAYVHPDITYDLKSETGDLGWRAPHNYSLPQNIMDGSIGVYEGFVWVTGSECNIRVDASNGAGGAGTVDVYDTLFCGKQALAKGYSTGVHGDGQSLGADPLVIDSPVVDSLFREKGMGWYHFVGYSVFRQASVYRLEAASSIGTNT